ncbi:MAG: CoA-acylating methylmalonate-semialdehyde dehydrogenase [Oligoflexia bacterium]|nr:CoA-acylating methylmalonate-semialdehyde dehydrogenase [Oligoflexia bacterium]
METQSSFEALRFGAEHVSHLPNVVGGELVLSKSPRNLAVLDPATGKTLTNVPLSTKGELDQAVKAAVKAQKEWGQVPVKDRVQVFFKLKQLFEAHLDALAEVIHKENGKTMDESRASLARGIECIEYATSLPQLVGGQTLEVSRGVECKLIRYPLGVVAGITPFNFPMMVPLWMVPLAIACGNAFILKPSEQTPISAVELSKLLKLAGLPAGIYSVVHGDREIVEAICDHPEIKAIGFVGSSKVAKLVHQRSTAANKRVRALGGAKNHLIVVPDADPEMAASNIVASVTGCAGQRCMAASVLVAVGNVENILTKVREKMAAIVPGRDIGPVISRGALERISGYIERAEKSGAKLVLDGRKNTSQCSKDGYYIGPSIIDNAPPSHESACDEIFGPVLTIVRCDTLEQALQIENANPYGNAAAIYTGSGEAAQLFTERASAGMVGINVGVPVPREPFAFGGWNDSRYGEGDITGLGAIDFWMQSKKVTAKWSASHKSNWMS